ncbi:Putative Ca2+/H+ antiporter, TMEM165/GDT1 family [Sporobacter termitidis DSM 10068]|uniref:GDT1 family protein n=1 Tax=Sporobacter termitidis DSM 10068 TaxID=1123282 RepID=A0A1M5WYS5_9FIRM|nr:TMEM165/GDT1 family protein [Sporobacter termitidis]SHH92717.1 Putative Ca2+/H+ antiporter, TMEM165/GDT1 family [Sporobacter termitidis DSM 10068]
MHENLIAFLFAAGAVVLAEMGDKTQLLAMAFATKYKASKVLLGVFIATVFNHALAVAIGNLITRFEAAQIWIQAIASLSFIFFGLWTIRGDKLEGEENKVSKFGAIATVGIAFFLAEMGDKTQLATIALAAKFPRCPVGILVGTTTGMLIADGIGIIVGVVLCKRIPEKTVKLISAGAFAVFGLIGSYQVARERLHLSLVPTIAILLVLIAITGVSAYLIIKKNKKAEAENRAAIEYCRLKSQNETDEKSEELTI